MLLVDAVISFLKSSATSEICCAMKSLSWLMMLLDTTAAACGSSVGSAGSYGSPPCPEPSGAGSVGAGGFAGGGFGGEARLPPRPPRLLPPRLAGGGGGGLTLDEPCAGSAGTLPAAAAAAAARSAA